MRGNANLDLIFSSENFIDMLLVENGLEGGGYVIINFSLNYRIDGDCSAMRVLDFRGVNFDRDQ